jgi:hypothetical protein
MLQNEIKYVKGNLYSNIRCIFLSYKLPVLSEPETHALLGSVAFSRLPITHREKSFRKELGTGIKRKVKFIWKADTK